MTRRRAILLLCLIAPALAGCGWYRFSLFRDDIRSVYVEFLGNDTFRRRLEVPLTRYVVGEIKLRTPFVFAPRDEADSVLSGTIVGADVSTPVKDEDNRVLLQRATVRVRFQWRDRLTGRDIVPERTVQESARTPVMLEEGIFEDNPEQTAIFDLALREAARRIVESMEQSW